MRWNKQQAKFPYYQRSRKGTSKTHEWYFIKQVPCERWRAGYRGTMREWCMNEGGLFDTPEEARAYCEKRDKQKWRCYGCKKEMKVGMWENHACEIEMEGGK